MPSSAPLTRFLFATVAGLALQAAPAQLLANEAEGQLPLEELRTFADVYNQIRACNPQPGAWTTWKGNEVKIFDSRKVDGSGAPGTVLAVDADSFTVAAQGGAVRVDRVRPHDDKKISAGAWAAKAGLAVGAKLGG